MEIGHQQARKYLQELHADGDLYISGWIRKGRAVYHAIYGIRRDGDTDEPRPEPISQSESMKRFRVSLKIKEQYAYLNASSEKSRSDLS